MAKAWTAPPPADSTDLAKLVFASMRFRDMRVLDAVLGIAESESAERLVRLSALQVLASYIDPAAYPRLEDMLSTVEWWEKPSIPLSLHVFAFNGSHPPDADTPLRVYARIRSLARSAGDEDVRRGAQCVYCEFQYRFRTSPGYGTEVCAIRVK